METACDGFRMIAGHPGVSTLEDRKPIPDNSEAARRSARRNESGQEVEWDGGLVGDRFG